FSHEKQGLPTSSILSKKHRPLHGIAKRATVTHICRKRLLEHKNLTADMPRMQVTAISQRIPLSGVEHIAGWNPDILGFARLQHNLCLHHGRSAGIHCVGHLKTMLGSGFVRHLQQDRTTRANFKIDDRDGWIPRLYFSNLNREQLGIDIQLLERLTYDGASLQ